MQSSTKGPFHSNPSVANCWKKIIHSQILCYLKSSAILTDRQFGFLPKSSTSDALATGLATALALHDWYGCLEDRKSIVMRLLDLSKTFDRVPDSPLLLKLMAVGLSGSLPSWFRSYLPDRSQLVAVHGVNSPPVPVFSGVPQGSVLGPLLFLIYVNDLSLCDFSNGCSFVLYADDATLYKPISQSIDLSDFQSDINIIHNWFSSKHLTANAAITKFIVISTKDPFPDASMHLNNRPIEVSSAKFLEIWASSNLSGNLQVGHICTKARRTIGYIHRAFHSAPIITSRILYLELVCLILEHGSFTWHSLNKSLTNRLESCQRFACRVVLQS